MLYAEGAMNPNLQSLRALHELDVKVLRLKSQRDEIPQEVRRLGEEIQHKQTILNEAGQKLALTRTSSDRFDLDIRSLEADINRLEQQLASASSNKQYNVFLSEIASKKADLSRLEDKALAALNSIDELVDEHKAAQEDLARTQQARDNEAASIETSLNQIDEQLAQLQQQRPQLAGQVEPGLLSQYERILAKRGETALVPVIDGACQGCFMKVTPEVANALKRGHDVLMCKSCSRIIYLP